MGAQPPGKVSPCSSAMSGTKPKEWSAPQFTLVSQISIFHLHDSSYTVVLLLSPVQKRLMYGVFSFLLCVCIVIFCALTQPKSIILIGIFD